MARKRLWRALGLMSGTSADGIDAALLETDGESLVRPGAALSRPYKPELSALLRAAMAEARAWGGGTPMPFRLGEVELLLTEAHAAAVRELLGEAKLKARAVDVIGFHGQTILHQPAARRTVLLGNGALLATHTGIDVVCDFRRADVEAGGQGAPLVPLYHQALAQALEKPLAVLNIGGVANVTYIGEDDSLIAFDTGPGNALIDDWVRGRCGQDMDEGGALASSGRLDEAVLANLMDSKFAKRFFERPPPKSLDRNDFNVEPVFALSPGDGAATLAAFTAAAVAAALAHLPAPPKRWLVTGGGRHNRALMVALRKRLGMPVEPVESVGWRGDVMEAEAFAYLAVRSLRKLPLSLPMTTGVAKPLTGGVLHRASRVPQDPARRTRTRR